MISSFISARNRLGSWSFLELELPRLHYLLKGELGNNSKLSRNKSHILSASLKSIYSSHQSYFLPLKVPYFCWNSLQYNILIASYVNAGSRITKYPFTRVIRVLCSTYNCTCSIQYPNIYLMVQSFRWSSRGLINYIKLYCSFTAICNNCPWNRFILKYIWLW